MNTNLIRDHQTILLTGDSVQKKREELREYFDQTWRLCESLYNLVNNDKAFYKKAEPLRHPLIFYYGHTATFFINKLKLGKIIENRVNGHFESMFAIGVDEMSWDDLDDSSYNWPKLEEVRAYRNEVKALVESVIQTMELALPITQDQPGWVILMGIEHERIHLETSSVIIRQLPLEDVSSHPMWAPCKDSGSAPSNELVSVVGDSVVMGKSDEDVTYGWDNEFGIQKCDVQDFKASKFLVSNQEFMEFVENDGYRQWRFWTEEGQGWLKYTQAEMPRFWRRKDGVYWQRNLTEEVLLPLNWPVEVNQLEAKAFCNWKAEQTGKSIRLLTEAEWHLLRDNIAGDAPLWHDIPGNLQLAFYASSCPINQFGHNGIYDIVGNVWQHTETLMDGYSGFQVHPVYDDFSTPTFDGKHNLIKGGSWISTGNEATRCSRYAFRRHFYQHAGFRYVESEQSPQEMMSMDIYETDDLVSQYLEFHFGDEYFQVPNFCVNGIAQVMQSIQPKNINRALDIGCAVGRSTFELAKYFEHVDGIDFSARFIQQAYVLTQHGEKHYTIRTEGELVESKTIKLDELGYAHLAQKVNFMQGDACNLKPQYTNYDLVFASNLIDRLSDPKGFLTDISLRINQSGYLVIMSPYTWLEQYTTKSNWIGGRKVNGENLTTLGGLTNSLITDFELVAVKQVPFVIRETRRKFQHSLSEMSIWRKR